MNTASNSKRPVSSTTPHVMLLPLSYIKKELTFISYPTFQIASSKIVHQKRKSCATAMSLYSNLTRIFTRVSQMKKLNVFIS